MFKKLSRNPWIVFSPFLTYYAYVIVKNKWPTLYGDEIRYVDFAKNLTHGFYSPYPAHINLWSGPGYPLILAPFVAIHMPDLYMTMLNAIFQYLAVVFLYKALRLITNYKTALICGLLFAIYPNGLSMLPILYTEALTCCLVSLFAYCVTILYIKQGNQYIVLSGIVLGFLTLTKIILGYVIFICPLICLLLMLVSARKANYIKSIKLFAVAIAICLPYLGYTYYITGKAFYWGNSGGMSLYWMSTPYEHEYGDWKLPALTNKQYPIMFISPDVVVLLKKNHAKEINFILHHNEIQQDELFKQAAISNIKQNPLKFGQNYLYNFSRMLFNFPYSYSYQDGAILGNIIRGSLILWLSVVGIVLTWVNWRRVIFPIKILLLVTGIYLLLSGIVSAFPRQLDVVVPVFLFWFGYLAVNVKKANFKFAEEELDNIQLTELNAMGVVTEDKDG